MIMIFFFLLQFFNGSLYLLQTFPNNRNTHGQTALDMAKTEDMREALIIPDGTTAAPQENTFMVSPLKINCLHLTVSTLNFIMELRVRMMSIY